MILFQICLTLGHLTTLLETGDLKELNNVLDNRLDSLNSHMHRVQERLIPERFQILIRAADNVKRMTVSELSADDKGVVGSLRSVFERES